MHAVATSATTRKSNCITVRIERDGELATAVGRDAWALRQLNKVREFPSKAVA